ncbi:porin family protein [Pseudolabrys taiwanensis]|uniref:Porin family protein n=1 Tax=Pseudolabrys taiwanensis TaxID=331696 RepID=A0A345ZWM2_9HYPH|nr:outer membrane beta-barrel protein [Pseudolabrys taiwanensis]AXK81319.1 porin family protein [Pseudolabrys taiwanensis]
MTSRMYDSALLRPVAAAALLLVTIGGARAADLPDDDDWLRGSFSDTPAFVRWDGVQFGATIGLSSLNANFGNSTSSQISYILRNTTIENEGNVSGWTTLPSTSSNSRQYGGFIGYNWQWSELVLGADLSYNYMSSLEASATDSMSRIFNTSDGYENSVTVRSSSSIKLVDYATLRGRAGYAIGQFLPYAMLGLAVGRFNYVNSASVTASGTSASGGSPYNFSGSKTDAKNNAFAIGFLGGVGVDVALLPNVFLRAEYEFISFSSVNSIRTNLSTGRLGVGVRF